MGVRRRWALSWGGAATDPETRAVLFTVVLSVPVDRQTVEEWRPGVRTRMLASAATGAETLCVFEQWCNPGCGAPAHVHCATEEVLVVLAGRARIWVEDEAVVLEDGGSVVVPASARHGFENVGEGVLHMLASLAAAAPPVAYEDFPGEVLSIGAVRTHHRSAD